MLDLLVKRRSVRKFQQRQVEPGVIGKLIKAVLLSPSSRNINPWNFIVINDKDLLVKLAKAKEHGSAFLKDAPLGIVVIADGDKSDVWVEDASIASILLQLTAQDLGLGSCWIQIRKRMSDNGMTSEEYVRNLLAIPPNYRVESIIAVGYSDQPTTPHTENELQVNKVHHNIFGQRYEY